MLTAMYFIHKDELHLKYCKDLNTQKKKKILLHDMCKTKGGLYSLCYNLN